MESCDWEGSTMHPSTRYFAGDDPGISAITKNMDVPSRLFVLDKDGLHPPRRGHRPKALKDEAQYVLPFLNESVGGEKVNCHVRRKDNQYVQVNLKIKLAG